MLRAGKIQEEEEEEEEPYTTAASMTLESEDISIENAAGVANMSTKQRRLQTHHSSLPK